MWTLTIIAPAYYQSASKVRWFMESMARHKVPVTMYGLGEEYRGWIHCQILQALEEIKQVSTSHVLCTDSSDVVFTGGMDAIREHYDWVNRPPLLFSHEKDGPNMGGWMGERQAMIDVLETLKTISQDGNPQVRMREAVDTHTIHIEQDRKSHIFQVVDVDPLEVINGRRVRNNKYNTWPSVLHFAGGYTDPECGKDELMRPLLSQLGYAI